MTILIDYSHVHRHITGIERISLDLFSKQSMEGLDTRYVRAKSTVGMMGAQWIKLPLEALFGRHDFIVCSGFPPSILLTMLGGDRLITYVHDLFLLTRVQDLNSRAKYYMRPSFKFAIDHGKYFLTNSLYTKSELEKFCSPRAHIRTLRPEVGNTFGLNPGFEARPLSPPGVIRLISIGTVEPRKNYEYTAIVRRELSKALGMPVELHIVGRAGWGKEFEFLSGEDGVILHGYCSADKVRELIQSADVFLCTSKEEGLGLPLLEVQHGGILVAASDIPVFREVLKESGCLLPLGDHRKAADALASLLSEQGWKRKYHDFAISNVARWNGLAHEDKKAFLGWLAASADSPPG